MAAATIVLTPVENPAAYGLVETDSAGNVLRFIEKPDPAQITTNYINAGIYVLEPSTFDRIPDGVAWSIERKYFPSLIERHETFVACLYDGYWIDIGTPDKYSQVHRDIMERRFHAGPFATPSTSRTAVARDAMVASGAAIQAPSFIDGAVSIEDGARVGPRAVVGRGCRIGPRAVVEDSILWPGCVIGAGASVRGAVLGASCLIGHSVSVGPGAVLGDRTHLTDFTRA
jgi:mannose-1-phosphate guanylyltransferase